MNEMHISIEGVSKTYIAGAGKKINAVRQVSLEVTEGEFVCLLGPSGCGKSTLLKLAAGIEQPDEGKVLCGGLPVTTPSPERGFIFQDYALFPWLSVRQNIQFGLKSMKMSKKTRREMVNITSSCWG